MDNLLYLYIDYSIIDYDQEIINFICETVHKSMIKNSLQFHENEILIILLHAFTSNTCFIVNYSYQRLIKEELCAILFRENIYWGSEVLADVEAHHTKKQKTLNILYVTFFETILYQQKKIHNAKSEPGWSAHKYINVFYQYLLCFMHYDLLPFHILTKQATVSFSIRKY